MCVTHPQCKLLFRTSDPDVRRISGKENCRFQSGKPPSSQTATKSSVKEPVPARFSEPTAKKWVCCSEIEGLRLRGRDVREVCWFYWSSEGSLLMQSWTSTMGSSPDSLASSLKQIRFSTSQVLS